MKKDDQKLEVSTRGAICPKCGTILEKTNLKFSTYEGPYRYVWMCPKCKWS